MFVERLMPTQEVIESRLDELWETVEAGFSDAHVRFQDAIRSGKFTEAMDRFGMEMAELEMFRGLMRHAHRNEDDLPAVLEHSENVILRGDWQPVSPCAMHRALHQAQSLARCKFVKRLREVLKDA
jgi:tRNA C32,U32 (ribose-2'-O)-methylase TrmJ